MKLQLRTRSLATTALVALLVATFGAAASPQPRDNQSQEHRENRSEQRQERQERRKDQREDRQERRKDQRDDRKDRKHDRRDDRREANERQRRADLERQRSSERYSRQRLAQQRLVQQRYQQQRYQQQRYQQQRYQQQRYQQQRYYRPATYRYGYGGHSYSTNQYGADMLRRAVSQGYQEGLRAGRGHRNDRWSRGYRSSRVWIDASYGYDRNYVRRSDYQHYFRQGFERGYEDGYNDRYRYGRYDNGNDTAIILTTVLAAILGLQASG